MTISNYKWPFNICNILFLSFFSSSSSAFSTISLLPPSFPPQPLRHLKPHLLSWSHGSNTHKNVYLFLILSQFSFFLFFVSRSGMWPFCLLTGDIELAKQQWQLAINQHCVRLECPESHTFPLITVSLHPHTVWECEDVRVKEKLQRASLSFWDGSRVKMYDTAKIFKWHIYIFLHFWFIVKG